MSEEDSNALASYLNHELHANGVVREQFSGATFRVFGEQTNLTFNCRDIELSDSLSVYLRDYLPGATCWTFEPEKNQTKFFLKITKNHAQQMLNDAKEKKPLFSHLGIDKFASQAVDEPVRTPGMGI